MSYIVEHPSSSENDGRMHGSLTDIVSLRNLGDFARVN